LFFATYSVNVNFGDYSYMLTVWNESIFSMPSRGCQTLMHYAWPKTWYVM